MNDNSLPDAGPEREPGQAELVRTHMRQTIPHVHDAAALSLLRSLYGDPDSKGVFSGIAKEDES